MLKKNLCVLLYKNPSDEVRGKTRRYLYEVKPNVFVGTVSPMVRETLWKIISKQNIDATIIYSDKNEQGFTSMSTHDSFVFLDFDGVLLPTSSKNILKFSNVFAKSDGKKLIDHLMEAGYIANALLTFGRGKSAISSISRTLDIDETTLINFISFLVALHDIGKAHPSFQRKLSESNNCSEVVSDTVSKLTDLDIIRKIDTDDIRHERYSRDILYTYFKEINLDTMFADIVVFHHQGKQGSASDKVIFRDKETGKCWKEWEEFQRSTINRIKNHWNFDVEKIRNIEDSFYINGFCYFVLSVMVTSDWIVSGGKWNQTLEKCNKDTDSATRMFVEENQLVYNPIKSMFYGVKWEDVFSFNKNDLQKFVTSGDCDNSNICIIEYPCGYGKTEAALALALKTGVEKGGIYLAAPTMSTAKGLANRCREIAKKAGIEINIPELDSSMVWSDNDMEKIPKELWTSRTRHQLLYPFAVGTIDQILKSIVKYRYSCIGMLGLSDKVVIIDEVHAYDAYMLTELECLIKWCKFLSVPVIILSATLPTETKRKLCKAIGIKKQLEGFSKEYPLVTNIIQNNISETSMSCDSKTVNINTIQVEDMDDVRQTLFNVTESIDSGCIALITPTVDECFKLYDILQYSNIGCEVIIYHGRMTVSAKAQRINELLHKFGKDRTNRPKKAIVVATSIIEQSLDVDFDYMFTTLAPIDLLVQRLGRVHRHSDIGTIRQNNKIEYPFTVVIPETYGNLSRIYDEEILRRTQDELLKISSINTVTDIRYLIDNVYSNYSPTSDRISSIRAGVNTLSSPKSNNPSETDCANYHNFDKVLPTTREETYPTVDVVILPELKENYTFQELRNIMLNNKVSVAEYKLKKFHSDIENEYFQDCKVFISGDLVVEGDLTVMTLTEDGLRIEVMS